MAEQPLCLGSPWPSGCPRGAAVRGAHSSKALLNARLARYAHSERRSTLKLCAPFCIRDGFSGLAPRLRYYSNELPNSASGNAAHSAFTALADLIVKPWAGAVVDSFFKSLASIENRPLSLTVTGLSVASIVKRGRSASLALIDILVNSAPHNIIAASVRRHGRELRRMTIAPIASAAVSPPELQCVGAVARCRSRAFCSVLGWQPRPHHRHR